MNHTTLTHINVRFTLRLLKSSQFVAQYRSLLAHGGLPLWWDDVVSKDRHHVIVVDQRDAQSRSRASLRGYVFIFVNTCLNIPVVNFVQYFVLRVVPHPRTERAAEPAHRIVFSTFQATLPIQSLIVAWSPRCVLSY